jgi:hypothetical protein
MGRRIERVPVGFQHPADDDGEPIPGAHLELLWDLPAEQRPCFQVYEDVSEGTPVSPVFGSAPELRGWLVAQGVPAASAEAFLAQGSAPSFVLEPGGPVEGITGLVPPEQRQAEPGAAADGEGK